MKLNTLFSMYVWAILSTILFSSLDAQETLDCEPRTILIKFSKENLQLPTGNIKLTDISSTKIRSLLQSAGFEEGTRIFPNFLPGDTLNITPNGHRVSLIDLSRYFKIKVGAKTDLNALVDSLKKVPSMDYVGLNWTVHPMQVELTDPLSLRQSGFEPINAFKAWSLNTGGDVKVAIIDGGVDYNHQDLDPGDRTRVLAGWDFGNRDSNPMDDLEVGKDKFGNHGTLTAGVIGAITNNALGVSGMCWKAQILPVKVIGPGPRETSLTTIAQGVNYAREQGADIISMGVSREGRDNSLPQQDPLAVASYNAFLSGIILIAPSGNDSIEVADIPARYPSTLAVGASNNSYTPQRISFSNYGSHIDVVAPGRGHHSTSRGNRYEEFRGTSLSAPIVSGVAGLLVAENKERSLGLTNEDLMQIIRISAEDITSDPVGGAGLVGWDKYTGYGMIDAHRALQFLQPTYSVISGKASGGTSVLFQGKHLHNFLNNNGLKSGRYFVEIYEVKKEVSFSEPFAKIPEVWSRSIGTVGWSAANPNDELNWAEVVPGSITKMGCTLRTFVYLVKSNISGQTMNEWWPCKANEVQFAYTAIGIGQSDVSGDLYEDVTWSGRVRVSGDITVPRNVTLTIDEGTEIHFTANTDETSGGKDQTRSELIIKGTLDADAGDITFRSTDDSATNADWYGIRVAIGGTADLSGATVQDGSRCVQNEGGTLTVDANTTLSNCGATVTLNPTPPYVNREITAKLENSDMSMTAPKWQWQWQRWRSTDAWANIPSARLATYTPTTKDIGSQLRATVRYQAKTNVYPHAQSAATVPVAGVPGAPQNLVAEETNEAVQLTWETPTSDGGTPITGYAYRYSADDGTTWQPSETGGQLDETIFYIDHTIGNLINGTEYTFEVWAVNKVGNGASASVKATPQALALMAVSFGASSYQAFEGGDAVSVVVQLSPSPSLPVRIPVVVSADPGTETADYTVAGLRQGKVWLSFAAGVSSQSFALTANEDADRDDETVSLSFETFGTWSASDGAVGGTGQARVTLRDNDTDTQPVFPPSGTAQEALTGRYFSFTRPSASGGNAPLSYSVKGSCPGLTVTSSSVSGQPSKAGQCGITWTVRDDDGDTDTYALQISVAADTAPSFASSGTSKSALVGQYFSFTRPAASGGNGTLRYSVSGTCAGLTVTTSSVSGQPSKAGQCGITWTVRDTDGDSDTYALQISVGTDTAPSFASSGTSRSALVGQYFSFTRPTASGGNGALRYSVSGTCAGLTVTSSSASGAPSSSGQCGITWTVRDTDGDSDTYALQISVAADTAPSFASSGTSRSALVGQYFSFTRPAASGGNGALRYSVSGSCSGLTVTTSSVSGQPSKAGQCGITWTVRDTDGDSDTYALQISVGTDTAPSFASSGTSRSALVGQYFSFTRPAASGGNGALRYSVSGSCPGLTVTTSSISGSPSKADQCGITWTVRDTDGDSDTYALQISVAADTTPSFASSGTSRSALVGQYFSFTRPAASGGNGALRYSVSGACPGLTITSSSVSGRPSSSGSCKVTWTVRDTDGDTDTYALQIAVAADTAPSFASSGTSRSALVGQYFSFTRPAASGGNGSLRYSVSGTCAGLTVTSSAVSGSPSKAGQCGITWTVRDTDGDTDTYALQIAVAADTAPSFASSGTSRSALVGQYFSFTRPSASGGNGSLRYSVSGTCAGLTVTASSASGAPSKAGSCKVTWTVRDTDGDTDTYVLRIAVAADTAPSFAATGTTRSATVGQYFSFTRPAASGGNGALTYSVRGSCAGLTVTSSSVSGAPSKAGSCRITWTVRDSDGDTDTYSLQLSVRHRRT